MREVLIAIIVAISFLTTPVGLGVAAEGDGSQDVYIDENIPENDVVRIVVNLDEYEWSFEDHMAMALGGHESKVEKRKEKASEMQKPFVNYIQNQSGVEVVNRFWISNSVVLRVDTSEYDVSDLASQDGVREVHRGGDVELQEYDGHYGQDHMNASTAWDAFGTGEGVKVAVLDTGVDPDHQDIDINSSNWVEYDGCEDENTNIGTTWQDPLYNSGCKIDSEPYDDGGHGTHVSSIVTGDKAGIAPGSELMHAKVLQCDDNGNCGGSVSDIIAGIQWAAENQADVVSMSLGTTERTGSMIDPIETARNDFGVIFVSSVGNDGDGVASSPGDYYSVISAGATNEGGDVASYSGGDTVQKSEFSSAPSYWPSQWTAPTTVAPGSGIEAAQAGGGWDAKSGTSFAAPHVTGAIAVALEEDSTLGPSEMRNGVENSSIHPDGDATDTRWGHGFLESPELTDHWVATGTVVGDIEDDQGNGTEEVTVTMPYNGRSKVVDSSYRFYYVKTGERDILFESPRYVNSNRSITVNKDTENLVNTKTLDRVTFFEILNYDVETPVIIGNNTDITLEVQNVGPGGTKNLTVYVDGKGIQVSQSDMTLAEGETYTLSDTLQTSDLTWGSYVVQADTEGDEQSHNLNIESASSTSGNKYLDVEISDNPTSVTPGSEINVTVNVTNPHMDEVTEEITVSFGNQTQTEEVTLSYNETVAINFTGQVPLNPEDQYTVSVSGEGNSDSVTIPVNRPATFSSFVSQVTEPDFLLGIGSVLVLSLGIGYGFLRRQREEFVWVNQ